MTFLATGGPPETLAAMQFGKVPPGFQVTFFKGENSYQCKLSTQRLKINHKTVNIPL